MFFRFNENSFIYGGCRLFMHNPKQPKGDPFGVMRELHEMPIYNRLTVLSWYGGGETLAYNCHIFSHRSKVKLYNILRIIRDVFLLHQVRQSRQEIDVCQVCQTTIFQVVQLSADVNLHSHASGWLYGQPVLLSFFLSLQVENEGRPFETSVWQSILLSIILHGSFAEFHHKHPELLSVLDSSLLQTLRVWSYKDFGHKRTLGSVDQRLHRVC